MRQVIINFFREIVTKEMIEGKRLLEVGSLDVNGSVKPTACSLHPSEYIGIDLVEGPGVDLILPAEKIIEHFGINSFDMIISTETLEHVIDWRLVINNIKRAIKEEGYVFISTPVAQGKHLFPTDCWRFNKEDWKEIWADFEILILEQEQKGDSLFLLARKPKDWTEKDLSDIEILSVVTVPWKKRKDIPKGEELEYRKSK